MPVTITKQSTEKMGGCNGCDRGKLNAAHDGIDYPYKDVWSVEVAAGAGMARSNFSVTFRLCETCLHELRVATSDPLNPHLKVRSR